MKAESSIKEEFNKKFKEVPGTDYCVWYEILKSKEKIKTVAFRVDSLKISPDEQGYKAKACLEKSNEILKKENENFNEDRSCYEWTMYNFKKVDCKKQKWFTFCR